MQRIIKVSKCLSLLFQMLLIAYPLFLTAGWLFAPQLNGAGIGWGNAPNPEIMFNGFFKFSFIPTSYLASATHPTFIMHDLTFQDRILGLLISTIPMLVQLFIFHNLIKLFKLYSQKEIFGIQNVLYLKNIAVAFLVGQIVKPLYETLIGVALTWQNPVGQRICIITFDQTNLMTIFIAALILLISWIMLEGSKIRDEQLLTV